MPRGCQRVKALNYIRRKNVSLWQSFRESLFLKFFHQNFSKFWNAKKFINPKSLNFFLPNIRNFWALIYTFVLHVRKWRNFVIFSYENNSCVIPKCSLFILFLIYLATKDIKRRFFIAFSCFRICKSSPKFSVSFLAETFCV